jgi:ureidoacrylate peracid hydrolase
MVRPGVSNLGSIPWASPRATPLAYSTRPSRPGGPPRLHDRESDVHRRGQPGGADRRRVEARTGRSLGHQEGLGGFANTPLDTILDNLGVNTCVVAGVTTCVCVSTMIREGVEYNYRMIIVSDAVAEVHRDTHEAELKTMARIFADVKTTGEVIAMRGQRR